MNLPLLWQECRDAFLQETFTAHSGSMKTLHAYASELRNFFACSNKSPERCTRQDVITYMARPNTFARRQGQPPAPGTRNHRLVVIRRFYEYAARYVVSDGYGKPQKLFSGENPAAGIRRVKIEHRPSYLTEDEIMRFFAAIDRQTVIGKRDYALFLTLFLTARRKAEIAGLLWGDIEWGDVSDERSNRQAWRYHFRGKGRSGQDDVAELPEPAYAAIMQWLEASGRLPLEPDDPIFTAIGSPNGGGYPLDPYKRLSDSSIRDAVKHYAERAGLEKRVYVHIWRHSSAKHRLDNGESIFSLKETLRHKSLDQTYHYARSMQTPADLGAALLMEKFADL